VELARNRDGTAQFDGVRVRSFSRIFPTLRRSLRITIKPNGISMNIQLSPIEARIIGCLIEKAITTPDQYPLSLNALTNACNQKSNRDPVLDLDERAVQENVDALARKHLVLERSGFGSRVQKYQHRFCNTGFGSLELTPIQQAIVCELLVRGPQTPGELRTRCARLAEVHDVSEIESALAALAARDDGPFVVKLPREPGRRDSRYAHLFSGEIAIDQTQEPDAPVPARSTSSAPSLAERVAKLEEQVAQLMERMGAEK
jgi:uncharacterized protein YceH (UPF0502 family)